jgi:RNA polymerase sigma factor (sigma-70 family)
VNTKEFNIAVKEYSNRLIRFSDKILLNTSVAKDIAQDCFIKLWENKDNVAPESAKSWLFTCAYRMCLRYIQSNKRFTEEVSLEHNAYEMPNPDLKKIVKDALDLLNENQKAILMLKDYEGYSYQEIGEILQLNESQVKVYLFRARQIVREYIVDLKLVF